MSDNARTYRFGDANRPGLLLGLGARQAIPLLAGGPGLGEITRLTPASLAALLFLGIVCSGIAYVFWYDALKTLQAAKVGALIYIEPVVAVIVAQIVLGEPILPVVLLGGGLILFGVWLVR